MARARAPVLISQSLLPLPARTCSLDPSLCFVESVWQSEHQTTLLLCLKPFRDFSLQENKAIASVITSPPPRLWPPFQCSDMPLRGCTVECFTSGVSRGGVLICSVCQSECKCSLSAGSRAVTEHGVEGHAHPSKPPQAPASPFPPGSLGLCRGGYWGAHPQSTHSSSFGCHVLLRLVVGTAVERSR